MISRRQVATLSLTVTALVWLVGVYALNRQPFGVTLLAIAAGITTLGWGTLLRSRQ